MSELSLSFEERLYALLTSEVIFRTRTYQTHWRIQNLKLGGAVAQNLTSPPKRRLASSLSEGGVFLSRGGGRSG